MILHTGPLTTAGVVACLRLAILSVDADGSIVYWNRGAEELFGHRWDDVFGRRALGLLPTVEQQVTVPSARRPTGGPPEPAGGGTAPRPHLDALDRLHQSTAPVWAGPMAAMDRDGRAKDVLWWSYRLTESPGPDLLVLAANAEPLRTTGPRLAVGDRLLDYASTGPSRAGELRLTVGFAKVADEVLAERLGSRLSTTLPRANPARLDRMARELVSLGYPVLTVDDAGPFAVLPQEVSADHRNRPNGRRGADRPSAEPGRSAAENGVTGTGAAPPEDPRAPGRRQEAQRERSALLQADAMGSLDTALDLDATARALCSLVVPRFADLAAVEVVDQLIEHAEPPRDQRPDEMVVLRRLAVEHSGLPAATTELAPEGELLDPVPGTPWGRFAEPMLTTVVTAALAEELSRDLGAPDCAPLLVGHSLLSVPLPARGTVLGRMLLLRGAGRRPFDHEDLTTAARLATQGALRLHSARMHLLESKAAATLQRSMLPTSPPRLPGVRIAHHYRPGDRQAQVGGDWFDAVQLPGGRVALVVGDVMGHGLHSAAVMGQFRTAVQTMAALDLPPAQLLRHLDNLAHKLGPDHLATCIYTIYDPVRRTLTLANAGHVPPVLSSADGPSQLLQVPAGAPIGVGGVPFETAEIRVPDGSWLVLCTDGLVEVRDEGGIGAGLAALCENVIEPDQTPEEVCGTILGRLHSEDRSDDVALLVARFEGIPSQDVAEWKLALNPTEVRTARALTHKQLTEWGLGALGDLAELLVSELVTNALRAASRSLELRLMRVGKLLVEVTDDDHNLPLLRRAEGHDEAGRGLALVSNLSARWGTSRQAVGKVVWFELPLPHGTAQD